MKNEKRKMQLVAVIDAPRGSNKKGFWTKIGVAFENNDGSWNLLFDYLPTNRTPTTIQLREFKAKDDADGGEEERDAAE